MLRTAFKSASIIRTSTRRFATTPGSRTASSFSNVNQNITANDNVDSVTHVSQAPEKTMKSPFAGTDKIGEQGFKKVGQMDTNFPKKEMNDPLQGDKNFPLNEKASEYLGTPRKKEDKLAGDYSLNKGNQSSQSKNQQWKESVQGDKLSSSEKNEVKYASARQKEHKEEGQPIDFNKLAGAAADGPSAFVKEARNEGNAEKGEERYEPKRDETDYQKKWGADIEEEVPSWKRNLDRASKYADNTVQPEQNFMQSVVGTVKNVAQYGLDSFQSAVVPVAESFGNKLAEKFDGEKIGKVVNNTMETTKNGVDALKSGVSNVAENIKETAVYAAEAIPSVASGLKNKAGDLVSSGKQKADDLLHNASAESLKENVSSVFEKAKETVSSAILGSDLNQDIKQTGQENKNQDNKQSGWDQGWKKN